MKLRITLGVSVAVGLVALAAARSRVDRAASKQPETIAARDAEEPLKPTSTAEPAKPVPRPQLDGHGFPDKVLALTWDDGPDAGTFELAQYLHDENVSATFFVVGSWREGVSSDPGEGTRVFDTGYEPIPVLGDLVGFGHRIANHTLNHVLLSEVDAATVRYQLAENQARLDPFITNGFRFFRAPGGAWNAAASQAVDADPRIVDLVGPIRWDVDGKDWEKSLYCRSSSPSAECEKAAPGRAARVKPSAVAKRYLDAIEAAGRGVVLLHDRVGHVGSRYAIEIARRLIPALKAKGYVFAAPVLRFSSLAPRPSVDMAPEKALGPGDVNGDGRDDRCARTTEGIECALASSRGVTPATTWVRAEELEAAGLGPTASLALRDVNGDGRADLCGRGARGVVCGLAP